VFQSNTDVENNIFRDNGVVFYPEAHFLQHLLSKWEEDLHNESAFFSKRQDVCNPSSKLKCIDYYYFPLKLPLHSLAGLDLTTPISTGRDDTTRPCSQGYLCMYLFFGYEQWYVGFSLQGPML
jgi:hypothetical protein